MILLVVAVAMTACGGIRRVDRSMNPQVLADTLMANTSTGMATLNMVVQVPPKYVTDQSCVALSPVMAGANNVAEMPQIIIKGRTFDKKNRRQQWLTGDGVVFNQYTVSQKDARKGMLIEYSEMFPYQNWMANSTTKLYENCYACNKFMKVGEQVLAGGLAYPKPEIVEVIFIPAPVQTAPVILSEMHKIQLYYKINSAVVMPDLDHNAPKLAEMETFLKKIANDPTKSITSIEINATSSPDGIYASNKKLAMARAMAIKSYMANMVKGLVDPDKIHVSSGVEPWSAVLPYVKKADLSHTSKAAIKKMIDNAKSMAACERSLRSMPSEFKFLSTNVLPLLREASYKVNYTIVEQ